ncbi:hypothetical protein DRO57_02705 [Candidatus Bathyarchaeota archaeon]|nr:MAG: hypothetical protein DRO57_02705 [Candidatus Bathyarchaeota archaeon]
MGRYVTVSVKIPVELRERMRALGIKPSDVLRRAIEEEVRRRELKRLREEAEALGGILDKIPMEDVVRSIREDRDSR